MRLPAPERRQQLIDVACEIFAERGFHATAMDDIAVAAGVTKPVLYQHFPSKRAFYLELLGVAGEHLKQSIAEAVGRAHSGRERVENGFRAYFAFATRNRSEFRLLFGASVRNDPEFAAIAEAYVEQIAEMTSQFIEIEGTAEHRRVLAHAIIGISESTSRRLVSDPGAEASPEQLASWLAELAWFGLRGVRGEANDGGVASVTPLRSV